MNKEELNAKIQMAYEKALADFSEDKNDLPLTTENVLGYALLYSGKVTAYLLEELGLIN